MSEKIDLNVSEFTLERLRCSVCKDFLSCPPIRLLPDGTNICGRCSPPYKDMPAYVQLTLEAIMRDATFPCKFSKNGCKTRLLFGYTNITEHEADCAYGARPKATQAGCSSNTVDNEVISDVMIKVEEKEEEVSIMNNSTVVNPFNMHEADCAYGARSKATQAGCSSNTVDNEVISNDVMIKVEKKEEDVSIMNNSTVVNPFNMHQSAHIVPFTSLPNCNEVLNSSTSLLEFKNWNGNFNNSGGANRNQNSSRKWHNMTQSGNMKSKRCRPGRQERRLRKQQRVVIVKGHTVHIHLNK